MTYSDREKRSTNKVGKMDMVGDDNAKIANKVIYKSVCNTTSQSRSGIQLTQSGFKLIRFNDDKKGQAGKPVGDKDVMADVANISDDIDNCLLFKNNVKYK